MTQDEFKQHLAVLLQRWPFPEGSDDAARSYSRRAWSNVRDESAESLATAIEKFCDENFARPSIRSLTDATVVAGGGTRYHITNPDLTDYGRPNGPPDELRRQWSMVMAKHKGTPRGPVRDKRTPMDEFSRAALKRLSDRVGNMPTDNRVPVANDSSLKLVDALAGVRDRLPPPSPPEDPDLRRISKSDFPPGIDLRK